MITANCPRVCFSPKALSVTLQMLQPSLFAPVTPVGSLVFALSTLRFGTDDLGRLRRRRNRWRPRRWRQVHLSMDRDLLAR
jgi:hypothetical protein